MEYCNTTKTWLALLILLLINLTSGTFLPPIIWDPYHPLFSCKEPMINVKRNDILRFICPDTDLSSHSQATRASLNENAFFLDDTQIENYNNCNATAHKASPLKCDGGYKSVEYFVKEFAATPYLPVFESGKTYFVIGTGYRFQENVNNLVGGSCSNASGNAHRLRLKIHVCTDEEIASGKCTICTTQGCYYKSCGVSCSNWASVGTVKRQNQCFHVEKRTCNNSALQEKKEEYKESITNCDNNINTGASTGSELQEEANRYKYISAVLSVVGLLVGVLIGVICYKNYHNRNCRQKPVSPGEMEANMKKSSYDINGTVNNGFSGDRNSTHMT